MMHGTINIYILYYILAYIKNNGDVSLKKKKKSAAVISVQKKARQCVTADRMSLLFRS